MYGATIGKLGILKVEAPTNQACCACVPNKKIYNKYLFYYLLAVRDYLIKLGAGCAQPNISKEKIEKLLFALPPLEEQKCIVSVLDNLLSKVSECQKIETKLQQL